MASNNRHIKYYVDIGANADQALSAINKVQGQLDNLHMPSLSDEAAELDKIQKEIIKIKEKSREGFSNSRDMENAINLLSNLAQRAEQISNHTINFKIDDSDLIQSNKMLKELNTSMEKAKKNKENFFSKIKLESDTTKIVDAVNKNRKKTAKDGGKEFVPVTTFNKTQNKMYGKGYEWIQEASTKAGQTNSKNEAEKIFSEVEKRIATLQNGNLTDNNNKAVREGLLLNLNKVRGQLLNYESAVTNADELTKKFYDTLNNEKLSNADKIKLIAQGCLDVADNARKAQGPLKNMIPSARNGEAFQEGLKNISTRIKQLTGAGAIFMHLRFAIRGMAQDIKELDEQFNEISIVTGRTMKDMWSSFSQVNRIAQEYGVTTQNVVSVQNLYYHQGRSVAEVNKLTAETLTLAKISGLEYSNATDKMTAALNAFKISAQDAAIVTDTTAKLASVAATDTKELLNALTKTASISANAGMDIASTEVFLTKMIETTRESSENLGTAMKTIVARFTELKEKKDIDMDGTVADFNRVDTALKSAGITLTNTAGTFRDVDEVFMDLSKVWDTLDRNTQRYIATQAAGSRQQSRFIAMIENYERTLELMNEAQSAGGTGAEQLARAQDSIKTSVDKLKSSWQDFYSEFMTSGIVKGLVDFGNKILTFYNQGNTELKTILTIVGAIAAREIFINTLLAKGTDEHGRHFSLLRSILNISNERNKQAGIELGVQKGITAELTKQVGIKKVAQRPKNGKIGILESTQEAFSQEEYTIRKEKNEKGKGGVQLKNLVDEINNEEIKGNKAEIQKQYDNKVSQILNFGNKEKYDPKNKEMDQQFLLEKLKEKYKGQDISEYNLFNKDDQGSFTKQVVQKFNPFDKDEKTEDFIKRLQDNPDFKMSDMFKMTRDKSLQDVDFGKGKNIKDAFKDIKQNGKDIFKPGQLKGDLTKSLKVGKTGINQLTKSIGSKMLPTISKATTSIGHLVSGIASMGTVGAAAVGLASGALVAVGAALVTYAVRAKIAKDVNEGAKKSFEGINKATTKYKETLDNLNKTTKNYEKFREIVDKGGAITSEEEQEKIKLQNDLAQLMPSMVDHYDDEGNAILKDTQALDGLIKKKQEETQVLQKNLQLQKRKGAQYGVFQEGTKAKTSFDLVRDMASTIDTSKYDKYSWGMRVDKKQTKEGLEKLSSANAFNSQTFGGLTKDFLRPQQFAAMVEAAQDTEKGFEEILDASHEYSQNSKDYLIQLNEDMGGALLDTFRNMGENINELLIEDAKINIQNVQKDYGINDMTSSSGVLDQIINDYYTTTDEKGNIKKTDFTKKWIYGSQETKEIAQSYFGQGENALDDWDKFVDEHKFKNSEISKSEFLESAKQYRQVQDEIKQYSEQLSQYYTTNDSQLELDELIKEYQETAKNGTDTSKIQEKIQANLLVHGVNEGSELWNQIIGSNAVNEKGEFSITGQIDADLEIKRKQIKEQIKNIFGYEGQNTIDFDSLFEVSQNPEQLQGFKDTLATLVADSGKTAGVTFLNNYVQTINSNSDKASEIQGALLQLFNAENSDQILVAKKALKELGVSAEQIEKIYQSSGKAGQTAFNDVAEAVEGLSKQLDKAKKLADAVKNALSGVADINNISTLINELKIDPSVITSTHEGFKIDSSKMSAGDVDKAIVEGYQNLYNEQTAAIAKMEVNGETDTDKYKEMVQARDLIKYQAKQSRQAADYARWQGIQDAAKKAAEKIKKIVDDIQKGIAILEKWDGWKDIDRLKDSLNLQKNDFQATIETGFNTQITTQAKQDLGNVINKQIASAQTTQTVAKGQKDIAFNTLSEKGYFTKGSEGQLVRTQKLKDLYLSAANETDDAKREAIEKEIEQVEKLEKQYDDEFKREQEAHTETIKLINEKKKLIKGFLEEQGQLEKRILDISIKNDETELNNYKKTIEKKKQSMDDYLNAVQETINKERQMRDLSNQEEDLTKKRRKLSILQMDTSGMYAGDIANLQNEINQDSQSLEDSYTDRYLDKLQVDNEKLQESYDLDIQAWEEYLEWKKTDMSLYNEEIRSIMTMSSDEITNWILANDSEIKTQTDANIKATKMEIEELVSKGISSMQALNSEGIQLDIQALQKVTEETNTADDAINTFANNAITKNGGVKTSISDITTEYSKLASFMDGELTDAYNRLIAKADEYAKAAAGIDSPYNDKDYDVEDYNYTGPELESDNEKIFDPTTVNIPTNEGTFNYASAKQGKIHSKLYGDKLSVDSTGTPNYFWGGSGTFNKIFLSSNRKGDPVYYGSIGNEYYSLNTNNNEELDRLIYDTYLADYQLTNKTYEVPSDLTAWWDARDERDNKMIGAHIQKDSNGQWRVINKKFKTGGYVDYTGPAWVDGTPTKPEAFLSAADTARFEQLKLALQNYSGLKEFSTNNASQNTNNTFEININVDELGENYSVEDLKNEIENEIYKISTKNQITNVLR